MPGRKTEIMMLGPMRAVLAPSMLNALVSE
jgi:hypothetical protein